MVEYKKTMSDKVVQLNKLLVERGTAAAGCVTVVTGAVLQNQ